MSVQAFQVYRRTSLPRQLQIAALAGYAVVFVALLIYGKPGIGIGQGFFVPVVLASLGGGIVTGIASGFAATLLYEVALTVDGVGDISARTGIHLLAYVAAGTIVGHFAGRARVMLTEALQLLENLLHLARRDLGTGALSSSGLESITAQRIAEDQPFSLLLGEVSCENGASDDVLRAVFAAIAAHVGEHWNVGRIGPSQLAVIGASTSLAAAHQEASDIERLLDRQGHRATFGWTLYPTEGDDTLTLFRAATERLYARRLLRGEWAPTHSSSGLAEPGS